MKTNDMTKTQQESRDAAVRKRREAVPAEKREAQTVKKHDAAPLKKNDITQITIEDMSDEGLGIGHAAGMAVFVKDAVVGDRAQVRIVKVKKTYAFARLEQLLSAGPDRVDARCPVARSCGGCQLQEMSYPAQLKLKEEKVRNNLIRIGGFRIEEGRIFASDEDTHSGIFLPVIGMENPWHYRNKAQFPVGRNRDGKLIAGFFAGRTHTIIDNHQCDIGIEENRSVLETVLSYMEQCHLDPYDEETGKGTIRHVMTRAGFATGELMVVIVAACPRLPHEEKLIEMLKSKLILKSVVLNINREKTNVILGKEGRVLYGSDHIEDRIGSLTYRISSKSFYQVNPVQTAVLYETALKYAGLTGKETVWDLYCGTGTISLFLARQAGKVIGVEVIPEAIEDAKENAKINHIDNCEFIVGRAEDMVEDLPHADVIVVDPPRKGLDRTVIDTILKVSPKRIVYVSCDSATLARDLKVFSDNQYHIEKVQPVDQFCHTVHVETVCLLSNT